MSVWSAVKNFFVVAPSDVAKQEAAIRAKADADVADLHKRAATKATSDQHAGDVAAAERVLAVIKAKAPANPTPASPPAASV